jgi:hypothetical protein
MKEVISLNTIQSNSGILDQYRVEVGDTDRSVEEIIRDIKNYGEPVVRVDLASKAVGLTAAGSVITISVAANSVDEQGLKSKLNEAGGCMYQIASVSKHRK